MVCEVGLRLPYEQTSQVLHELRGIEVPARQVERIVDHHGKRAIEQRQVEIETLYRSPMPDGRQPDGPDVLYIEMDGAWINSRSGLRAEGKVGLVHQGPRPVGKDRAALHEVTYCVTFQGSERLGEELYLEADRQGLEQAERVIVLGDGAQWIRGLHQTHFHDATYVLDWFHLRRNLARALQPVAAELDADYIAAKRMTLRDFLWVGDVEAVLQRLDQLHFRVRSTEAREALTSFKRFLRNNRDGVVCYADLFEQGIHVGSGPIEKTADLIINRRCELRGMTWYPDTADGICNLRAIRFNHPDRWQAFWQAA